MASEILLTERNIRNFWRHVDVRGPDECWPWTGHVDRNGYGHFSAGGAMRYSHQVSLVVSGAQRPNAPANQALHGDTCTTRACCNPTHLRWGSVRDNMDDRQRLGRTAHLIGEQSGTARLTEGNVLYIRASPEISGLALAAMFNVTPSTIVHVRKRRSWAHLP
jgi:hypothetical protein